MLLFVFSIFYFSYFVFVTFCILYEVSFSSIPHPGASPQFTVLEVFVIRRLLLICFRVLKIFSKIFTQFSQNILQIFLLICFRVLKIFTQFSQNILEILILICFRILKLFSQIFKIFGKYSSNTYWILNNFSKIFTQCSQNIR